MNLYAYKNKEGEILGYLAAWDMGQAATFVNKEMGEEYDSICFVSDMLWFAGDPKMEPA